MALSHRATSARCQSVNAARRGARNSRNPAGSALTRSNSSGTALTDTTRFAKGRGALAGFSFAVAVALFLSILPGLPSYRNGPAQEKGNSKANGQFRDACNCFVINHIQGDPGTVGT